jgi:hypothetical protein
MGASVLIEAKIIAHLQKNCFAIDIATYKIKSPAERGVNFIKL